MSSITDASTSRTAKSNGHIYSNDPELGLAYSIDRGFIPPTLSKLHTKQQNVVDEDAIKGLRDLTTLHIDSFDYMLNDGLKKAINNLEPVEFVLNNDQRIKLCFTKASIFSPVISDKKNFFRNEKVYPAECRLRRSTYKGQLFASINYYINDNFIGCVDKFLGDVPIMLKSEVCNLKNLSADELVARGEEANEVGGYFVVKGMERLIRLIIAPRRNFPLAIKRQSWKNRGPGYTEYGLSIRCVRDDQEPVNNILHYLEDGSANLCFGYGGQIFFVPIILIIKALRQTTDLVTYYEIMKGSKCSDEHLGRATKNMMRNLKKEKIQTMSDALRYIGERFRIKADCPPWYSDEHIGRHIIEQSVFVHLKAYEDKYRFAISCLRKLFAFAQNKCCPDSSDTPMMQEIVLPGHVYLNVLKDKLHQWLRSLKYRAMKTMEVVKGSASKNTKSFLQDLFKLNTNTVGSGMEHFLITGYITGRRGYATFQNSGWTIILERINYARYISHFRSAHRGSIFTEIRSTEVRKLYPESWGFLCPVHTPDGSLCGLLTHLSSYCTVTNNDPPVDELCELLHTFGMVPTELRYFATLEKVYEVLLNGRIIGTVDIEKAPNLIQYVREQKAFGNKAVPKFTEICLVEKVDEYAPYPGIYIFTTPCRMVRPVINLATQTIEYIGSFEQVYLGIGISDSQAIQGHTTHIEITPYSFMSIVANLTPFSEFNQSPRNMYQCQMCKQTIGTPCHWIRNKSDNKMYRLTYPQSPIVKTRLYDHYAMDEYPNGTNAIVAVLSYTGYDMEDAMVINKASVERGFASAMIFYSDFIDLNPGTKYKGETFCFGRTSSDPAITRFIDPDGLPAVGTILNHGDPYYSYIELKTNQTKIVYFKKDDTAIVEKVCLLGHESGNQLANKACILFRVRRDPIVGDKFSSRHGQKGVCSRLYPVEDLPFNDFGFTPDIIFNPHGFPSRMTVGMMIEFLAGKSGAVFGKCLDGTPFQSYEELPVFDYYGKILKAAGFSYYGTETMYSGIDGRELSVDIFSGVVYYQRLRHMVSDKFQVRRTGAYDFTTRQPIKGRKRGGGIRIGEMERDAIVSHGCSFTLIDRLLNCSDRAVIHICKNCGLFNTVYSNSGALVCRMCEQTGDIRKIVVPYVLTFLVAELSAMNIQLKFKVGDAY